MVEYPVIYRGTDYGFDPNTEDSPLIPSQYRIQPGQFGLTTRPDTANQLKEVSDKLNTGARTIELTGISTQILEAVPDQHLREIARLKRLAGADITFHGPLVEPTGITQQGWDESQRLQAEKQIWDAVKRGQQLMIKNVNEAEKGNVEYEDNNLVVTLHTSNGLLNPKIEMKDEKTGMIRTTALGVVDEKTGRSGYIPVEEDEFEGIKPTPDEALKKINKDRWNGDVTNLSMSIDRGRNAISEALKVPPAKFGESEIEQKKELDKIREVYKLYHENSHEYTKVINQLKEDDSDIDARITALAYGEGFVRDAYHRMKDMYNQAKDALEREKDKDPKAREALSRLKEYREDASKKLIDYQKDPLKIKEFADKVAEGMRLMSTLDTTPQLYRKIEEFAVEKAAETFAGVAYKAYDAFGEKAPILSLENPPVGMGLSRAEEIKNLVEATRKKLSSDLQKSEKHHLTQTEADAAAKKLIGVTWDVGHINMLKKYGFDNEDLKKQTETIKPYLKHIHLSDNFGLEHTELPMGMGNVPMKEHLAAIGGDIKKFKAIIETGDWYRHFNNQSPLPESLAAFGSPIYPMQMQPYWDKSQGRVGAYFAGYGMNPEIHHSIYQAGFSGLPTELGGQIGGGRNRLSGAPME